jgi:hypothetical protein
MKLHKEDIADPRTIIAHQIVVGMPLQIINRLLQQSSQVYRYDSNIMRIVDNYSAMTSRINRWNAKLKEAVSSKGLMKLESAYYLDPVAGHIYRVLPNICNRDAEPHFNMVLDVKLDSHLRELNNIPKPSQKVRNIKPKLAWMYIGDQCFSGFLE